MKENFMMAKVINEHLESYDESKIEVERNTFQCFMCFKNFKKQCALKKHERNHNNIKKIHCEVCEKSFLYPKLLETHKSIHTVKSHLCAKYVESVLLHYVIFRNMIKLTQLKKYSNVLLVRKHLVNYNI